LTIALVLRDATRLLAGNARDGRLGDFQTPAFNFLLGSSSYSTDRLLWQECNWPIFGSLGKWRRRRDFNANQSGANTYFTEGNPAEIFSERACPWREMSK
jgi:hypothetical protein